MTDIVEAMAKVLSHRMGLSMTGARDLTRDMICACHDVGGLVLREMPEDMTGVPPVFEYNKGRRIGWNAAPTAVRDNAVKVK